MRYQTFCLALVSAFSLCTLVVGADAPKDQPAKPIQPAEIKLGRPVDFEQDVFPILDAKCIACHNVAIAENGLNLEDVEGILKGGKRGPSVVAKQPDKSPLYQLAARGAQPAMPPLPNKVEAAALTPQELGTLRQWILEGAGAGAGSTEKAVQWQPVPKGVSPIYSLALTYDGQYVAFGRANEAVVYHVPTGSQVGRLTDPNLLSLQYNGKPMYGPGASHRDYVHSLAFSPNGRMLATGGYREVKLWTRPDPTPRLNLAASTGNLSALAVSPDGKWLATASADNTIKLWDLASGKPGKVLGGHTAAVTGLQFTPDNARLHSASQDKSLRLWNVADGAAVARIDTPAPLNGLALSLDGAKVIAAGADNLIRVYDAPVATRQLATAAAPVPALATSPDKKWLAVTAADGKVALIDLATGKPAKTFAGHTGAVHAVSFSSNSARLITGGADKTVRIWDLATGQPVVTIAGSGAATAVALHPGNNQAASGTAEGAVIQWKLDTPAPRALAGNNGVPAAVAAVSADGKQLATAGTAEGKPVVFLRDLQAGTVTKTLAGHTGNIAAVAFSADGSKLITGSADKTARVWNLADGKELVKFAGHANTITAVGLSANGQQAVSGAADNAIKVWNVADAKELANLAGHTAAISAVAITPNGQSVVSASADQTIRLWNPTNGQQTGSIAAGQPVTSLALSPDGNKLAATGTDASIRLYQLDGKLLATLAGHTAAARSVAFSSDNARLVSTAADNQTLVWDVATGALLEAVAVPKGVASARFALGNNSLVIGHADNSLTVDTLHFERSLPGNTKSISRLLYNAAGDALFTASEDGSVRRFATANGQQQFAQNHGAAVHDLALSPDGNLLATAGDNKQVHLWNAANGANAAKPTLDGLPAAVRSVCFSLDGQALAAGTASGAVWVYNTKTWTPIQAFAEHAGSADCLAAAGETGKLFITGSADKTVRAWPLLAGLQIAGHTAAVTSVALNPTAATQLLSGSADGTVRIWDLNNGNAIRNVNAGGPVLAIAVRPDGQAFASAGANNSARLWNMADGKQLAEMKGDVRATHQLAERTADDTEVKAEIAALTKAIAATEKSITEKEATLKKATEAKATADKDAATAAATLKTATDAKTASDKLIADTAAAAKAATDEKAQVDKVAAEALKNATAAKTVADKQATDTAAAAKTAVAAKTAADKVVADAEVAAKAATEKAVAAKAAAEKAPEDKALAAAKTTAETAATAATAALQKAQAAKVVTDKAATDTAAAAKTAVDAQAVAVKALADITQQQTALKAAADKKVADTAAASKTATAAKPGIDKAVADATAAAKKADEAKDKASDAFAQAERETKNANDLLKKSKAQSVAAAADQKAAEAALATAKTAAAALDKPIRALAFSRDGTELATAGDTGAIYTWNAATGSPYEVVEGHTGPIQSLAYGLGRTLVSGSADKSAKAWDLNPAWVLSGVLGPKKESPLDVRESPFIGRVLCVAFSPDGTLLATGGGDPSRSGEITLWNVPQQTLVRSLPEAHSDTVFGVDFSHDGKKIATGGADKFVRTFEVATGKPVKSFEGHTNHVLGVSWKADGKAIASAGADNSIKIWNVESGEQQRTIAGYTKQVTSIQFIGRSQNIISCGGDKTVRMFRTDNGQTLRTFAGGTDFMFAVAASDDEKIVVSGGQDGVLRVWNGTNAQVLKTFEPPKPANNQQAQAH